MRFRGRLRPVLVRDEPRVAVAAVLDSPRGPMTVVNTHLSFIRWWNSRQLRMLMRSLETVPAPLVLMGDLNMEPPAAAKLTGLRPLASGPTFPAAGPREQIDHILACDTMTLTGPDRTHRFELSDHLALSVDLDRPA
jgi:endonuclease/exonuclease/phosphatase family metal-dependent hydrolase